MGYGYAFLMFFFLYFPLFLQTVFLGKDPFFAGEKAKSLLLQRIRLARNLRKLLTPLETLFSFLAFALCGILALVWVKRLTLSLSLSKILADDRY